MVSLKVDPLAFWLLLPGPLLMVWGYFRYGTVFRAFNAYYAKEWTELRQLLDQVVRRDLLRAQDRAYFDLLEGVWALYKGDAAGARKHLELVEPRRLRTDNIRSKLFCYRAEAALGCGDSGEARDHLVQARALPHEASVDEWISTLAARAV